MTKREHEKFSAKMDNDRLEGTRAKTGLVWRRGDDYDEWMDGAASELDKGCLTMMATGRMEILNDHG